MSNLSSPRTHMRVMISLKQIIPEKTENKGYFQRKKKFKKHHGGVNQKVTDVKPKKYINQRKHTKHREQKVKVFKDLQPSNGDC